MPNQTENLQLYKTDMETDGNDLFNFDTDLNQNWDKIDSVIGKLSELTTDDKTNLVKAIVEIISKLDKKTSVDLDNLSSIGQALLGAKIEAEALCGQNGYIKFKLNKIREKIIFQWGKAQTNGRTKVIFPIAFNIKNPIVHIEHGFSPETTTNTFYSLLSGAPTSTGFYIYSNNLTANYWLAVGY